jgi:hypothetical protein
MNSTSMNGFASNFAAGGLTIGTYPVSYNYAGNTNFTEATAHGFGTRPLWIPGLAGALGAEFQRRLQGEQRDTAQVAVYERGGSCRRCDVTRRS